MTPAAETTLSVILCTHNPRADLLARTIENLRAQTARPGSWELIVVDNASREPLSRQLDLTWHPRGRVVLEPALGLTNARRCGIAAATSALLLFVDDDNLLAPDYIEQAWKISAEWPRLGVWGCGRFIPEWETPPNSELAPLLSYLAVNEIARDTWSNHAFDYAATPAGAGLCVRIEVAREYARRVCEDPRRIALGRTGTHLGGCEDFDLAQTAVERGYGCGIFRALSLRHLMPAGRVEKDYLLRLVEGHAYSTVLLMALYNRAPGSSRRSFFRRWREFRLRRSLPPIPRAIHDARRRGESRAFALLGSGTWSS